MLLLEGEKPTQQNLWRVYGEYIRAGRPSSPENPVVKRLANLCTQAPGQTEIIAVHFQPEPIPMFSVNLARAIGNDNFSFVIDTDMLRIRPEIGHPYAQVFPLPHSPLLYIPQEYPVVLGKAQSGQDIEIPLPDLKKGWNELSARQFRDMPRVKSLLMRYG